MKSQNQLLCLNHCVAAVVAGMEHIKSSQAAFTGCCSGFILHIRPANGLKYLICFWAIPHPCAKCIIKSVGIKRLLTTKKPGP